MDISHLFSRSNRWVIALWLAVLLPLAQAAAVRHEMSHLGDPRVQKASLVAEHCEQCLAAAALGGLAPPTQDTAPLLLDAGTSGLAVKPAVPLVRRLEAGYRSRAPPSLTC